MPVIYPSVALKNQQREIKAKANKEIVYITENGWGKYVFMSEDVLEQTVSQAVEQALYEKRVADALTQSRANFEQGNFYTSREEMMAAVAQKRAARNTLASASDNYQDQTTPSGEKAYHA